MFLKFLYGLVAGISDLYFLAFIAGTVQALGTALFRKPIPVWVLIVNFLACILASLLYHILLANHVTWLTPGELIVGKKVVDLHLREAYHINIVTIQSQVIERNIWGKEVPREIIKAVPGPDDEISEGDILVLFGNDKDLDNLARAYEKKTANGR